MKRPSLAFGLVIFTLALLFLFLGSSTLFVALPIAVMVLLFYIFTKKESVKKLLIIPVISITILISSVSLTLNNHFVFNKSIKYADTTSDIVATVVDVTPKYYILKTKLINSEEESIKILFVANETDYKVYDNIFIDDAEIIESPYDTDKSEKCIVSIYNSTHNEKVGEKEKDFYYYILNLKFVCFEKLSEYLYNDSLGVSAGMLFGGTDYISNETKSAFRTSGVAHLLAVSGLHTSLWCGLILNLLKLFKVKERFSNIVAILVLFVLSVISGFTPSVIRASFMMGLTLIAPIFKKHSDSINSLGLSAGIIILINPYSLYSPSFYLSFLATLGVVLSSKYSYALNPLFNKFHTPEILKRIISFIYTSVLISIFATLFTLPASVYYFGVVSIISPLTNLLSVNLAFCTMVATLISLLVSFIPFNIFSYIAEFLFTITDLLLKLLISIVKAIGNLTFTTITANENFVYIGLGLSVLLLIIYYISLNKFTLKTTIRRLFAFSIVLPTILSLILSVIPFKQNTEFIVLGNTNTPNIIIRCGRHYAIINPPQNLSFEDYESFPKSSSDSLDLLAITNSSSLDEKQLEYIYEEYNIKKTMLTPYVNSIVNTLDTNCLNMSEVSGKFNYSIKNEINIRIFDTYGKNCAIIEFNEKFIVLSFSEYNDLIELEKELGKIDVLVLPENVPDGYTINVDTLIVCSDYNTPIHNNDKIGRLYAKNFYRAYNDDITIDFQEVHNGYNF
jgi:ComEC/Rec2-related protein